MEPDDRWETHIDNANVNHW